MILFGDYVYPVRQIMIRRQELQRKLQSYFDSAYSNKKLLDEYYAVLEQHGMNRGRFNAFVLKMKPLSEMTEEELFWFSGYEKLEIDRTGFFSKEEIRAYSKSKAKKGGQKYPIIFSNVIQIAPDQYVTTISTKTLHTLYNNDILIYNINTQRQPKVTYKEGKETYKISVNRKSIAEIKDLIERGLFISNDLSFNIRDDEKTKYSYDPYSAELKLRSGNLDILDGFHRLIAIIQVMNENPEFEKVFILNIMRFPEEKAKRFVAQQDKRNKIGIAYSKSLDDTKYETLVVNRVNESADSILFGQIKAIGKRKLDYGKAVECVKVVFNPRSIKEVADVAAKIEAGLRILANSDVVSEGFDDNSLRIALAYIYYAVGGVKEKTYSKVVAALLKDETVYRSSNAIKRAVRNYLEENARDELV